jgi:glutaminyl-tRNA synthetase
MQNFIRDIIEADLASGKHRGVVTRFPPEPNGWLHIGHAKAICVDFGLAAAFGGKCHLRMDDTNPEAEDMEYVEAIQRDIRWLGFEWGANMFFASDYYQRLYEHAQHLIRTGKAYVCSLSEDQMREYRGTLTEPGRASPYRDRSVEENLRLFEEMRAGKYKEGEHVVRAKADMASPNMKMRDPAIYRIKYTPHYRTGDTWCIYPLYDYTHCLSDAFEGITHSICTLEFENNRELYDWVLAQFEVSPEAGPGTVPCRPQQIEFARLNLTYTMMSKRKLLQLVEEKRVTGWDDPRMPTIAGMRRRGYTPESIRAFCEMIGVAKNNSVVDVGKLEFCVRDDLNKRSPRAMCVLEPLPVEIEGASGDEGRIFIERGDFSLNPPPKWHRLAPGRAVRLRHGKLIDCPESGVVRNDAGEVVALRCRVVPDEAKLDGKHPAGVIHWVSQATAKDVEVRLYDRLFDVEQPEALDQLNPSSLVVLRGCKLEAAAAGAQAGDRFQFERQGYFCVDPDSKPGALVFNRTITLRDTWAKETAVSSQLSAVSSEKKKPAVDAVKAKAPSIADLDGSERSRAEKLRSAHDVSEAVAIVLAQNETLGALFDAAVAAGATGKAATVAGNLVANELKGLAGEGAALPFGGAELGELAGLVAAGSITGAVAKDVLARLAKSGGSPKAIVAELGATTLAEADLAKLVDEVIAAHPAEVERYRGGKTSLLGFFVGQVMKKSRGKADAKAAQALVEAGLR